jgi:predicted O-methyltransferase YrrM
LTWIALLLGLAGVLILLAVLDVRRRVTDLQRRLAGEVCEIRAWAGQAETAQQDLVATLRADRQAAEQRQQALLDRLASGQGAIVESAEQSLKRLSRLVVTRQREATREAEALAQLFRGFEPRAPMPSSGYWALNPTELLELWYVLDQQRPELVLELGSGVSSTWIGYAVERYRGRLVSVDHDPMYAQRTRAQLRRHGLTGVVEVRDAPLGPLDVDGEGYRWYEPAAFDGLAGVDLLLVDGPPGDTGPQARYPAFPVLEEKLSDHATMVLDDADRPDEQEIVRRWTGSTPGLVREPATLGHLAVMTYDRPLPTYRGSVEDA